MSPLEGAASGRLLNHGKEVMGLGDSIETEQTDVATLLDRRAPASPQAPPQPA